MKAYIFYQKKCDFCSAKRTHFYRTCSSCRYTSFFCNKCAYKNEYLSENHMQEMHENVEHSQVSLI